MSTLPTFNVRNLFTSEEIDTVNELILKAGKSMTDDSSNYPDQGKNGRYAGKIVANNLSWDYHDHPEIENILTIKLEILLQKKITVTTSHILESKLPYLLHTDFVHDNQGLEPEYTIIIPLDTYDSITVCFNEWAIGHNDFEIFKNQYQGEKKLKIDTQFCVERLSHIHPKDLQYLSIHDTFEWNKGSVFVMDRRYFHCSDNFLKRGLKEKRGIVLWTSK